jgi:hypothetical protein
MSLVGIGSAIAPWLGEWATVAVIVEGIRDQFDSNEMLWLKQVIAAAEGTQPETGGLFLRCYCSTITNSSL